MDDENHFVFYHPSSGVNNLEYDSRKKRGLRNRKLKKYRLCSHWHESHLYYDHHENRRNFSAGKNARRKYAKQSLSNWFITRHGVEAAQDCCPTSARGLFRNNEMKPRFFNKINKCSNNSRNSYRNRCLKRYVTDSNVQTSIATFYDVPTYFYDHGVLINMLTTLKSRGLYVYSREVSFDRYSGDLRGFFTMLTMFPCLKIKTSWGESSFTDNYFSNSDDTMYRKYKMYLQLVDGNMVITNLDFITILAHSFLDTSEKYYYATSSNLICQVSGSDMQKIIDSEARNTSPKNSSHKSFVEDGKGLYFGGSFGKTKRVSDEDDDETEYEIGKILRKSVTNDFS